SCTYPPDIGPRGAMRRLPPLRAGHSPLISFLRSVRSRGSAIARRTSSDKTASESRNRQTHTPYSRRQSNILSDGCPIPRKKETKTLRAGSSCRLRQALRRQRRASPRQPRARDRDSAPPRWRKDRLCKESSTPPSPQAREPFEHLHALPAPRPLQ